MTNKDSVMQITVYIVHDTVTNTYLSTNSCWGVADTCQIYHRESDAKSMCTRRKNEYERGEYWIESQYDRNPSDPYAREYYDDMMHRKTLPNYGYAVVQMRLTPA